MIILIGQNHDDVLYFENVLRNKKVQKPLFDRFPIITGLIFNQEICLVYDVVTSYMTGIVVTHLIEKYNPISVIMFGRCKGITKTLKNGDIAISRRIVPIDIDQTEYFNVKVGEIPNAPTQPSVNNDMVGMLSKACDSIGINNYHVCTFLSANTIYTNLDELSKYGQDQMYLGVHDKFVLDSDCISPFLICNLKDIPFISVKIIDSKIGEESNVNNFVKTLEAYAKVGKSVTSFIGEIGRRDLVS